MIENIKDKIIERAAQILAERLLKEMPEKYPQMPFIPKKPINTPIICVYACPSTDFDPNITPFFGTTASATTTT